ncbi:guanine nucleotide-binding protein G(I)/G(S)/G(O) subunit gamma-10 isoform X2 [Vulpes vulpes]|uniref:Guanine nucleotide-binding protein G(I)/G(S)/G(O) subunit gamma-10 isoform X2 n=1 Tax=Vulpes vulpes TaxID=9627 RepID=A0ABM4Y0G1_VULVU
MSSGASVNALQRLVEQLKLEAGVERIKGLHGARLGTETAAMTVAKAIGKHINQSRRQLQSFNSTACRMPVRMPCW